MNNLTEIETPKDVFKIIQSKLKHGRTHPSVVMVSSIILRGAVDPMMSDFNQGITQISQQSDGVYSINTLTSLFNVNVRIKHKVAFFKKKKKIP